MQRARAWPWLPWALVAGACVYGLVMLQSELTIVQPPNDEALHFEMVRWAAGQLNQGRVPFDGWFPYLNLGLPQFSHYQSLPHLITAYLSLPFGTDATERWVAYLLLALFPLSVFIGARLLGWSPWPAALSAFVSPLLVSVIGYGYEHDSYVWLGSGLWSQEWGMVMLPIAWGLSWRAVDRGGRLVYAAAALALALTIAVHFMTGYLALLSVAPFIVARRTQLLRRLARGAVIFAGAALIALWVVFPLLTNAAFASRSVFDQNTFWYDSYGAPQVIGWLFTGQIFDANRLPVVSILVLAGAIVCAFRWRRDARCRALLLLFLLSFILFSGRPTFGLLIDLLPGSSDMQLFRYILGIHLAGILLAGVALAWLGGQALRAAHCWLPRVRVALPSVALTGVLTLIAIAITSPAWLDRIAYNQNDAAWISTQVLSDRSDGADLDVLINDIKAAGGGRTYAGLPNNWGKQYLIGGMTAYTYLTNRDVDEVGNLLRVFSLTQDNEAYFDDTDPAQYQLYNVRFVLMPDGMKPSVAATLIASSGRHRLWQVGTTGYLQLVDTAGSVIADRSSMSTEMQPVLRSAAFHAGFLPTVAFDGSDAPLPTAVSSTVPMPPIGSGSDLLIQPEDGYFAARMTATRTAAVVLKATYDPGWRVTVDGVDASTYMVVPGFVATTIAAGTHTVVFQYVPHGYYPLLLAAGGVTLLALVAAPALWMRRRGIR